MSEIQVVITQPGHADRVYTLGDGATRMGRADDNEIVLPDVGVSRRHAQIVVDRGEVSIEDLGSGNGTYYQGFRVKSQALNNGDEVVIDPFVLRFRLPGAGAVAPLDQGAVAGARLEVVVGTGMAGNVYPIATRGLTMGRAEDRDVVIPDPASSRHHCHIYLQDNEYVLHDNGSANGVFVNSVRVRECTLTAGDLVRIGNTEMRFVRNDGAQVFESTTQVVPPNVWDPRAGEQPVYAPQASYVPASTSVSTGRSVLPFVVGGIVTLGAVGVTLVLVVLAALVLVLSDDSATVETFPRRAPAWTLRLPGGLASASADELFREGVALMSRGDHRLALQNLYRVLETDHGNPLAESFAFGAGEMLLLDKLEEKLQKDAATLKAHHDERDELLATARRSGAVGQRATRALQTKFRDDPVVLKAMNWEPSDDLLALRRLNEEGADAAKRGRHLVAARNFRQVLSKARDADARRTAIVGVQTAERELARAAADSWRAAVLAQARGDQNAARDAFAQVVKADEHNVSARLHLGRIPIERR